MIIEVVVQRISETPQQPTDEQLMRWTQSAAKGIEDEMEIVIRIVDEAESQVLNRDYRGKDQPTNVLSFPFEAPAGLPRDYLGDLVICAPVVSREAAEQGKSLEAHWAHMVIHGMLHLRGYDHLNDAGAAEMEGLELEILSELGYPDPYAGD